MTHYSDELLNDIRNNVDLVETASAYVHLKRSGNSYVGCCPFHKEKTPSFHIDPDKQLYYCFGCGAGGSIYQFIMAAEGLDFHDAVKLLADRAGIVLPDEGGKSDDVYRRKREIYAMNKDAARFFRNCLLAPEGAAALAYFQKRQLSGKTIASFGLGYAPKSWNALLKHLKGKGYPESLILEAGLCIKGKNGGVYDRFRDRVMFPIIDVRRNVIGFGGRIMEGDGAKYINSPESIVYDKGKNLFALNFARKSKRGYYVLVEGYMDVISLHQAGIDCAVAGCGTALTEAQARLIAKGNVVYLCYDMDEAGQKALARAEKVFGGLDARLKVISIPDGKDADEFIKKYGGLKFEELLTDSDSVTGNKLDALLRKYDIGDVAQKVELINEAAKIFAEIPNKVEREAYIKELSVKTGISEHSISVEVNRAGGRLARKEMKDNVLRSVSSSRGENGEKPKSHREVAEARLLGLLSESKDTFDKLEKSLDEGLFSTELHKEIFSALKEGYTAGETSAEQYLTSKFAGREAELAAVIIKRDSPDNPVAAATDYVRAIESDRLSADIDQARRDGDLELLNRLLKNIKNSR